MLSDKKLVLCFSVWQGLTCSRKASDKKRSTHWDFVCKDLEFFFSPLGCILHPEDNAAKYSTILVWILLFQV